MEAKIKTNSHDGVAARTDDLLKLASDIVAAYVSNNPVPVSELPSMIKSVHATLGGLSGAMPAETMAEALRKGNQILRQRAA